MIDKCGKFQVNPFELKVQTEFGLENTLKLDSNRNFLILSKLIELK